MIDICGCLHIHTTFSDGGSDIEEVIRTAQKAGLDFIVINDHNTLKAREEGYEGYHDGLLVIVGYEHSPPDDHHYLVMGIDKVIEDKNPENFVKIISDEGGVGIIAHPDHVGVTIAGLRKIPWKRWDLDGFTGTSVWDLMTDIQVKLVTIHTTLWGIAHPVSIITGPRKRTLKRWDEMNKKRRVVGICELDNHGVLVGKKPFIYEIFPNKFAFKTLRNHILLDEELTGNSKDDIEIILQKISLGELHIGFDYYHNTRGFKFYCKYNEEIITMGGRKLFTKGISAFIELPERAHIRLIRDGEVIVKRYSNRLMYKIEESGVYRVEAHKGTRWGRKPWIYSNPIIFTDGDS